MRSGATSSARAVARVAKLAKSMEVSSPAKGHKVLMSEHVTTQTHKLVVYVGLQNARPVFTRGDTFPEALI